ncbi:MAG: rhomboid family intramembrane serine protease [Cytophagaceae bacterium]
MHNENRKAAESLFYPALIIGLLWLVRYAEIFFELDFRYLGIFPRALKGLPGILTAPLVHGDNQHLLSNTLPLAILGILLVFFYRRMVFEVFCWIYILSGMWVWVSATSRGYHLGASGLIYGIAAFIFFSGIFRNDRKSMGLSLLVTIVYGGMVWGLFPFHQNISWETHFFGALAGTMCAWYYRKVEIKPKSELPSVDTGNQDTSANN